MTKTEKIEKLLEKTIGVDWKKEYHGFRSSTNSWLFDTDGDKWIWQLACALYQRPHSAARLRKEIEDMRVRITRHLLAYEEMAKDFESVLKGKP